MSPAEDAALLLAIVRRHLRTLRIGLNPEYPEEDWGFTAQQVVEKLLKAWIVLSDRRPPRVHELSDLASVAGQPLEPRLAALAGASCPSFSVRTGPKTDGQVGRRQQSVAFASGRKAPVPSGGGTASSSPGSCGGYGGCAFPKPWGVSPPITSGVGLAMVVSPTEPLARPGLRNSGPPPPRSEPGAEGRETGRGRGARHEVGQLPYISALLCDSPAGAGAGHPHDSGTPGPSGPEHHHDLYPCAQPRTAWSLQPSGHYVADPTSGYRTREPWPSLRRWR